MALSSLRVILLEKTFKFHQFISSNFIHIHKCHVIFVWKCNGIGGWRYRTLHWRTYNMYMYMPKLLPERLTRHTGCRCWNPKAASFPVKYIRSFLFLCFCSLSANISAWLCVRHFSLCNSQTYMCTYHVQYMSIRSMYPVCELFISVVKRLIISK